MKVPDADAYWISPGGESSPVRMTHIREIINAPEYFGLSKEQVEEAYRRHGEPLGLEGRARREIMAALIRDGWIRIRYKPRESAYTVELNSLTPRVKKHLRAWATGALEANDKRKYSDVLIAELSNGESHRHGAADLIGWDKGE